MSGSPESITTSLRSASLRSYVRLARPDHWFKNVFVLPGTALAVVLANIPLSQTVIPLILALCSVCLLASANYVLNEWLDAPFDRFHPTKRNRPSALGVVSEPLVWLEYGALAGLGLIIAHQITQQFFLLSIAFLAMAWVYNREPLRAKDRVFLDVLTESVNNPLRLLLGWSALVTTMLPPSSIILSYWMGGAFLMSVKRLAEFRTIANPEQAALYRRSFRAYSESSLLLSSFFYALTSAFFLGVFLIKYRVEFLLTFPLFALLFVWYMAIGLRPDSVAQGPESLHRERAFIAYVVFLSVVVSALFFIDIPWLQLLTEEVEF